MKIFVVGSGGREHAIAWRLAQDGHTLFAAPGNPGIAAIGTCYTIDVGDIDALVMQIKNDGIDFVVIGPEAPLCKGLADVLRKEGVSVFGPGQQAAQLEGSKLFSKRFFKKHGIRTSEFYGCQSMTDVEVAIEKLEGNVVVKADGLAGGKGVVVCRNAEHAREAAKAMLEDGRFGEAGAEILLEAKLKGRELSLMALCDGKRYTLLAQAEDHKAIFEGDEGPNTGGMGTVSPASWVSDELIQRAKTEIFDKTLAGLKADGLDFRGVLYAGLMVDESGAPWLLEYNVRFGDPETQSVFSRWQGDVAHWLVGAAEGELPEGEPLWDSRHAVCVVMSAKGYPSAPEKGDEISGYGDVQDAIVFHAGTGVSEGKLVTTGGRVLSVCALDASLVDARAKAYKAVDTIQFRGSHVRRDIGLRSG